MTHQSQLSAYADMGASGRIAKQHHLIMGTMRNVAEALTLNELAQITGIRLSSMAGRVNELVKLGSLKENGRRLDRVTERHNITWCLT